MENSKKWLYIQIFIFPTLMTIALILEYLTGQKTYISITIAALVTITVSIINLTRMKFNKTQTN